MDVTKSYEFIKFGATDVTKAYEFTWFGAMDVTKPYEFIGFGAMDVTTPCEGFGAMGVTKPYESVGFFGGGPMARAGTRVFATYARMRLSKTARPEPRCTAWGGKDLGLARPF